jgi:ABC-2 type transport system permease protein
MHVDADTRTGLPVPGAPDLVTRTILGKTLWESRRSLLGWSLSVGAVAAAYTSVWPTMNTPEMQKAIAGYPKSLLEALHYTDMTTAVGYVGSAVYGLLGALLITVYGIAGGARTVAGDEEEGLLDLLLAHPVGRVRAALDRFAAVAVGLVLMTLVVWLVVVAVNVPLALAVSPANAAGASVHLALLGLVHGSVSFAVGAATGRRGWAIGAGAAVAVLGYLASGVLPQIHGLGWTRDVSPWDWAVSGSPLANGIQVGDCGLLLALSVVLIGLGSWAFTRRDVGV